MLSKPINPNEENERKPRPMTKKTNKPKKNNADGTIRMTYKLDEKLFEEEGESIRLFGKEFVETNKNKCKIIIKGKEYAIKEKIKKSKLKNYGIKEEDKELEVILKGNGINRYVTYVLFL